jgi:hypothetical protein
LTINTEQNLKNKQLVLIPKCNSRLIHLKRTTLETNKIYTNGVTYIIWIQTWLWWHHLKQHIYSVWYSMAPISSSLLTITLHYSVTSCIITKYSVLLMTLWLEFHCITFHCINQTL